MYKGYMWDGYSSISTIICTDGELKKEENEWKEYQLDSNYEYGNALYTKTAYFKTDYYGASDAEYRFKIMPTEKTSTWGGVMQVGRVWYKSGNGMCFSEHQNLYKWGTNWNAVTNDEMTDLNLNVEYEVEYSCTNLSIKGSNGSTYSSTNTNSWVGAKNAMTILRSNDNDSWIDTNFIGRLYYFDVYESGILKIQYVPAMRKSDSVVGLYDRVSKTFLAPVTGSCTLEK